MIPEKRSGHMGEEQYLSRIRQLESEIEYLHGLLDNAGISYKREAKEIYGYSLKSRYLPLQPGNLGRLF